MTQFRFQDLRIWQEAMGLTHQLLDIADELEQRKLYRFAEQLRSSSMSMTNNMAEGSGSSSKREFAHFLNVARRSTFENANILILIEQRGLIKKGRLEILLEALELLCRKTTAFQKTLLR